MLKHPPSWPPPLAPADPAGRTAESWAEVRAHDQVFRYRRVGSGREVLLVLASVEQPELLWAELLEALSEGRRVILPEPPAAGTEVGCWLGDFLEGLGVSNVSIVAANRFCIPALELTFLGLEQIARVVLVLDAPGGGNEAVEAALRQAAVPLLVVHRGQPADEILRLVTDFLAGG
jgi:hypothetical protein